MFAHGRCTLIYSWTWEAPSHHHGKVRDALGPWAFICVRLFFVLLGAGFEIIFGP
jgi:hypothetical protein